MAVAVGISPLFRQLFARFAERVSPRRPPCTPLQPPFRVIGPFQAGGLLGGNPTCPPAGSGNCFPASPLVWRHSWRGKSSAGFVVVAAGKNNRLGAWLLAVPAAIGIRSPAPVPPPPNPQAGIPYGHPQTGPTPPNNTRCVFFGGRGVSCVAAVAVGGGRPVLAAPCGGCKIAPTSRLVVCGDCQNSQNSPKYCGSSNTYQITHQIGYIL